MSVTYARTIENVLNDILEKNKSGQLDKFLNNVDKFQLNGDVIEYSVILKYLKNIDAESRTELNVSCERIKESIKNCEQTTAINILYKILEYVSLEIPRLNEYEELKNNLDSFSKLTRRQRAQSIKYDEKIANSQKKIEKVQGEFISILSIFSAVIIAFFGGINLLAGALTSMTDTNKYKLLIIILLIGIIMFDVIYLLLYNISKIIKNPITVNLENKSCSTCSNYGGFKCLVNQYPIPIYYNIMSMIGLIILSVMYYSDKYNLITSVFRLNKTNSYIISLIYIVTVIIVIIVIIVSLYFFHRYTKCKSSNKKINIDDEFYNNIKINVNNLINEKNIDV